MILYRHLLKILSRVLVRGSCNKDQARSGGMLRDEDTCGGCWEHALCLTFISYCLIKYSNKSIKGEKFTLVHVSRILQTIREGKVAGVKIAAHITSTVKSREKKTYRHARLPALSLLFPLSTVSEPTSKGMEPLLTVG